MSTKKPTPIPHDPDSWLLHLKTEKKIKAWLDTERDYILDEVLVDAVMKSSASPTHAVQQIKRVGDLIELIPDETTRKVYYEDICTNWPVFRKSFKLSKREPEEPKKRAKVLKEDEWTYIIINDKNEPEYVSDKITDADKQSIQQYGFFEYQKAYYFGDVDRSTQTARLHQKSNFAIRILYHIKRSKNKNKRVVAIYNTRGQKEVIDIETKQLTSLNAFKEFTEGAGYYLFNGDNKDLAKLKVKLMAEEKPCVQLDTLGWQKKGFFAFSNGIIRNGKFQMVDEFGIVEFDDMNFFIPYHPGTEETSNMNEKRFTWKPGEATWEDWSTLYHQVFGAAGMITMVFGAATIFSDHIFYIKTNFPILFFYGEGGSGKSKMIQFIQHWYGEPQPSLKVSEKANTDKGKIRKMAQFSNAIALFEEFVNSLDIAVIKTFTGFYDRYGYERADMDSKYGTETVPVQSTVAFTGNEYPADDPLLQRMILIDHNVNEFSEEQQKRFDELNKMNRKGLTQIIMHLLQYRDAIEKHWEETYEFALIEFKKVCGDVKVPSRMIENSTVLIATYNTLSAAGLKFPFTLVSLMEFLWKTIKAQADKRDTGGAIQRFWDIVIHLLQLRKIENGKQLNLNGNELMIRVGEVHSFYMQEHFALYRQQGLNKNTLMQKLRDSGAFIDTKDNQRFRDMKNPTSCFIFDVTRVGVDLNYWIWEVGKVKPVETPPPKTDQPIDFTQSTKPEDQVPDEPNF